MFPEKVPWKRIYKMLDDCVPGWRHIPHVPPANMYYCPYKLFACLAPALLKISCLWCYRGICDTSLRLVITPLIGCSDVALLYSNERWRHWAWNLKDLKVSVFSGDCKQRAKYANWAAPLFYWFSWPLYRFNPGLLNVPIRPFCSTTFLMLKSILYPSLHPSILLSFLPSPPRCCAVQRWVRQVRCQLSLNARVSKTWQLEQMVLYCASKKEKKTAIQPTVPFGVLEAQGEKSFSESQKKPQRNWCVGLTPAYCRQCCCWREEVGKARNKSWNVDKTGAQRLAAQGGPTLGRGLESDDLFGVPIILIALIY